MSLTKYLTIAEMLDMLDEPYRSACFEIFRDHGYRFTAIQGSTNNHQAWPGGYHDHVTEIMNIGIALYGALNRLRPLPFSVSDVLLITFLHDIEKPWKYERKGDGQLHVVQVMKTKAQQHAFRESFLAQYGIVLTPEQANALKYVEGEFDDYSSRERVMGPLGALCHLADVTSARIWFDHPAVENDPWTGARRIVHKEA